MKYAFFIFFIAVAASGCYNDKYDKLYPVGTTVCDTDSVSYATTIQPILNANCVSGCHSSGGTASAYGDYTAWGKSLASYASNGLLERDITAPTSDANHMPQNAPSLSQCDIDKLLAWAHQGAKNN